MVVLERIGKSVVGLAIGLIFVMASNGSMMFADVEKGRRASTDSRPNILVIPTWIDVENQSFPCPAYTRIIRICADA